MFIPYHAAQDRGVYTAFIPGRGSPYRPVTASGPINLSNRSLSMDIVFIATGLGLFALFGVYAVLLRRV